MPEYRLALSDGLVQAYESTQALYAARHPGATVPTLGPGLFEEIVAGWVKRQVRGYLRDAEIDGENVEAELALLVEL